MGSNQRSNSNSGSRNYTSSSNRNKHNKSYKHNAGRNYHHDSSRRNTDYSDTGNNRSRNSSFHREADDYYQNQFSTYLSTNRYKVFPKNVLQKKINKKHKQNDSLTLDDKLYILSYI